MKKFIFLFMCMLAMTLAMPLPASSLIDNENPAKSKTQPGVVKHENNNAENLSIDKPQTYYVFLVTSNTTYVDCPGEISGLPSGITFSTAQPTTVESTSCAVAGCAVSGNKYCAIITTSFTFSGGQYFPAGSLVNCCRKNG